MMQRNGSKTSSLSALATVMARYGHRLAQSPQKLHFSIWKPTLPRARANRLAAGLGKRAGGWRPEEVLQHVLEHGDHAGYLLSFRATIVPCN